MNFPSRTIAVLLLLAVSASASLLDGTVWEVQAVPTSQTAAKGVERFDDVLTFSRGKLVSTQLKRFGIHGVVYSAEGSENFLNWKTTPMDRDRNKAQWDGVIKTDSIKGNLQWTTREGRVLYFFINGTKR